MKTFVFLLLALLFLSVEISGQVVDVPVYDAVINKFRSHPSLEFDVEFLNKSFSSDDTVKIKAHVHQVKMPEDSLFGGNLLIDLDSFWVGYNGENILVGRPTTSELIMIDPVKSPSAYIKSTLFNELYLSRFFTGREFLKAVMADTSFKVSINDTIVDGVDGLRLLIRIPEYIKGYTNEKVIMIIDKNKELYHVNTHYVENQGNVQFRQWKFSNMKFSQQTSISFLNDESLAAYEHITIDTLKEIRQQLKNVGFLKGRLLHNDEIISLLDDPSEFILLDFWFSSCYACIKGIPVVNRINEFYGPKGLNVYGVNPIDKDGKSSRIIKYMNYNPMSFPTILVDADLRKRFDDIRYPTILLLDKNRNVIYQHEGFNERLFEELAAVIEKHLK